jgi:hypothetical protein
MAEEPDHAKCNLASEEGIDAPGNMTGLLARDPRAVTSRHIYRNISA